MFGHPAYSDTRNITVIVLKFEQCVYYRVMGPNDTDGMAHTLEPDERLL